MLALSLLIRPYLGVVGLLVGTAVAGGCIGVMGVLLPGIVKRDYPASVSLLTGLYTAVLCTGASFAAGATEPLRVVLAPLLSAVPADAGSGVWLEVLFDAWRGALAFWFIPALLAGVVWWSQLGRKNPPRKAARPLTPLYRNALAWQVTLFMGLQSSLAYSVFGWLPSILQSRGLDPVAAGLALSASIMIQIITAIALPWIASRMRDQRAMITLAMGLTLAGIGGCIYAPVSGVWFWIVILGLGQGGAFSLALTLLVVRAEDADTAARLSGMAQGVGYTLAALGPLLLGLLHDQFGGWKIAGILLGVITLLALANGLAAGRDRLVSA